MLNLSHCSQLRVIPPKMLSSLKKLEVLNMENSFCRWKVEGSNKANENASLDELKDLPISSLDIHIPDFSMLPEDLFFNMKLKRYKIFLARHFESQGNYGNSKTLILRLESSIHLKHGVPKLLEGVEHLHLYEVIHNVSHEVCKSLFNSKVSLPKIERLELSYLNHLFPLIWDEQLSDNSFSNLKTLRVERCGFVKLVPLHVLKSLNKLEELEVMHCDKLEMVFDFEDLNGYKGMESSSVVVPLKMLKLWRMPKLKNVWSNDPQGTVSFPCLRSVKVSHCESLTSMFLASIAKGMLHHLEDLRISHCGIDVIVAKDQVSESVEAAFEFPRLTSLTLDSLPNLRNFYQQRHTLKWPQLQRLCIENCDELEIFEKKVSSSSEIYEEESTLSSKYPLLSYKCPNLEELALTGKGAEMIGSGQFPMYYFPKVKLFYLSIEKAATIWYASLLRSFPNLESLYLEGDFEEIFGGDNLATLAPLLSTFTLMSISNMISLAPSLLSSPNLTHLEVKDCDGLTILMASSAARCMVHLTYLSISNCDQIEVIITKQQGGDDDDQEIIFSKLKSLELDGLPRLKSFCGHNYTFKFPFLDKLTITGCHKFKTFSQGTIDTPSLKSVQLSGREIWDTNLNKTFYQQRFVASREVVLDEDDAIMIRNIDQFPVYPCPKVEILAIERIIDEELTIPYALLERFPQLRELRVENCSFEGIFSSHVPPSSTAFHNLTELKVSKCHHLLYLVTNSTAKCLVNLETLEIDDCQNMEEIVRKELNEDGEGGITFNGLIRLRLARLPRLKTKYEEKRDLNIEDGATSGGCRSLFGHNTVLLPKLEILELSNSVNNLISWIWDEQILHNSFSNLKTLLVHACDFIKVVPLHVLKSLNNLEKLQVYHCNKLEMVFAFDDLNDHKEKESSSLVAVPLNLTHLKVEWCGGLTTLMTSSAARCLVHLTHLSISYCRQIEEIITKQEGEDDDDQEIVFSKLEFLKLHKLPRLKRFCCHNYTFKFPLLKSVPIIACPQITMFCPGAIHAPLLESVQHLADTYSTHTNIWKNDLNTTIQDWFAFEEVISTTRVMALNAENITVITDVFPEVRDLYVESFQDEGISFPYSSLERFPKLYSLYVEHCSFEEIIDQIVDFVGKVPPFEELHIANLDKLKYIWNDDSQLPPIHQNLARLEVRSCCNLVKLVPSTASFQNLRELSVSGCHQLIHLVTTSTAKSLVRLTWLNITDCKKMEEIVMNETNEDVQGAITFNRLWSIQLTDMPSLKMFSSQSHNFEFPELIRIEITGCPEMKMFCQGVLKTPKLSKVKIEDHDMKWKDRGDLNKTIETLSSAKDSINYIEG